MTKCVERKKKRFYSKGASAEEGKGQEPSVLLGCQGQRDITQDTGEAIEDESSWVGYAVERGAAIVQESHYELMQ